MVVDAAVNNDARSEIMSRIRAALRVPLKLDFDDVSAAESERAETVAATDPEALSARFVRELGLVGGDAVVVGERGVGALAKSVADHITRLGYQVIAVQCDEFASQAASQIPADKMIETSGASAEFLERADCAIIAAESLIADTGSAVVRVSNYQDRLLPYLPPACIIVGRSSQLVPSLNEGALGAGDLERGERVIVTGPSRTADIEKTVVLGAHGPGSLTVFVVSD